MDKKNEKQKGVKRQLQQDIIDKVYSLMREKDVKQAVVAEALGMDSSKMSRKMNKKGDVNFSIEDICALSDFFNVPTDYLLGRDISSTPRATLSNMEICRQIMRLIESDVLTPVDVEVEEDTYKLYEGPDEVPYPYEYASRKNRYRALYISNYKKIPNMEKKSENEADEIYYKLQTRGNYNDKGDELNAFIDYFIKFYDLYKNNGLSQDMFETAIEDRLKQMKY